jgi:rhodanese-related sulfurtransferase
MNSNESGANKEKKIRTVLIVLLILITAISVVGLTYIYYPNDGELTDNKITVTYAGISPRNASNLINTSDNIIIVDIRECKCNYNKGHLIDAVWDINPLNFYNSTSDLLIYDNFEDICIDFCEILVNNTYGDIYYLQGGITAWQRAGYPTVREG